MPGTKPVTFFSFLSYLDGGLLEVGETGIAEVANYDFFLYYPGILDESCHSQDDRVLL